MLLAEELLLIALDPIKGTVPLGAHEYVEIGLSGALLAELAMAGLVTVEQKKVLVTGPSPDDPLLAEALAACSARGKAPTPKAAVTKLDKALGGVWHRLVDRQVESGTLGQHKPGKLSTTHHPVLDTVRQEEVLSRVREAAAGDGPLPPRDAVLLALAGPCRLLERVAPERSSHRHAKARIKEAIGQAPFAPEVKKAIDELIAAAAAVVVVTSSAGYGG